MTQNPASKEVKFVDKKGNRISPFKEKDWKLEVPSRIRRKVRI